MMATEADRRSFFTAKRRAFLGDGLGHNWTIQREHFPTFEPILDFIHPIEHLHKVSQAIEPNPNPNPNPDPDADAAWQQTIESIDDCWRGNVEDVIGILKTKQVAIGMPPEEAEPRTLLAETIGYLSNNSERMNYPAYRQAGLPTTSCLIESQIKEMNHRLKGTEKIWNDGHQAEAILQVVTAMLSDEEQLARHFQSRPGATCDRKTTPK